MRILAVEDEPRNVALLRAILARTPHELRVAETLAAAREAVADAVPDLLLLDRHLPDGDGLDLARALRATEGPSRPAILLVSASVLPVDRAAALDAGCDGFIEKPIRIDVLLGAIDRVAATLR